MGNPRNLLRPWAMDPEKDGTITCPICLGVADLLVDEGIFACRRCGSSTPAPEGFAATMLGLSKAASYQAAASPS